MRDAITQECLTIRKEILENEYKSLNSSQKEAVFHVNGPLLILAGAGSGKTTVLIKRIANIIRHGDAYNSEELPADGAECIVPLRQLKTASETVVGSDDLLSVRPAKPWEILAITFTNKAAGELKDRLNAMLGDEGRNVWASTFHSACARFLRRDAERIGYSAHFTVYDTDDSKRLMRECQKALNIEERFLSVKSILSEISRAKDKLLSPTEFSRSAGNDFRLSKIAEAYEMYQRRLLEGNAMDFDDLLFNAVRLLEKCPDVLEYYQNRFRYVLVDEYQDTNRAQFRLIQLLAGERQNLCVVGDDDQSIYKFRGATIENILNFERYYPQALVIRLEQNYRSTQNILDAANNVISNNKERKGKTLWTNNGAGEKLSLHTADNEQNEANVIVDKIIEQVARGRSYSDFAILYRMNAQSNAIEKSLIKSGIPYRIIGGHRFYERKEIRDMIAYLSVINNPNDEIRLRRIINQPKRAIGDKTVDTASTIAAEQGISLFEVLSHADEYDRLRLSAKKLMAFADMINELRSFNEANEESLHDLYERMLHSTGYIASMDPRADDTQDRIDNINELASNLLRFEEEMEEVTLSAFLEEVSLLTDIDNYNADASAVVLMTIHSAKGLEFPVVFLPGFEEGIFPGYSAIMNPPEIEEERRLAYVALTRAKQKIYILNAEYRMLYGSTNRNKLSRFVSEIPEELIERTRTRQWQQEKSTYAQKSAPSPQSASMQSAHMIGTGNFGTKKSDTEYNPGDRVRHKAFGEGTILKVSPMGNDMLIDVEFDSVGTKKLMSNFARLQKI